MKVLFAITTANQIEYTIKIFDSLTKCKLDNIDVVVFDDASNDGTVKWCEDKDIQVVSKKEPKGLTHSWNLAYKKFKKENYTHLILSNNDLVIPENAIANILKLNEKYAIVGPLSTEKGVGHQPLQNIKNYYDFEWDEYDFKNTKKIQDYITENNSEKTNLQVSYINGFFFSLSRKIIDYELPDGNIFDSTNINVGNESELCDRVKDNIAITLEAYIFHFKGISFKDINFDQQHFTHNIYRDLNWREAEKLKKSFFKRLLYKIKHRYK